MISWNWIGVAIFLLLLKAASTNLINKDTVKPTVAAVPSPGPSTPARLTEANVAESKSNVSTAGNSKFHFSRVIDISLMHVYR